MDMLGRKDKMVLKYYEKRTRSRRQASHTNRNGMKWKIERSWISTGICKDA
jgi:hypothetical protein